VPDLVWVNSLGPAMKDEFRMEAIKAHFLQADVIQNAGFHAKFDAFISGKNANFITRLHRF